LKEDHRGKRLALSDAGPKGLGVFATGGFRRGERVLRFAGPLLPTASILDFTHTIQVDAGLFLGASGALDDYVNHSCEPTCGLRATPRRLWLVALHDIAPRQEITFDYSTCLLEEPPLTVCHCESATCRGQVSSFWELDPEVRDHYRGLAAVPAFILQAEVGDSAPARS
jgi:hypothetical protein